MSFAPIKRAAIWALHDWVNGEQPPPVQPRIVRRSDSPAFARDPHGNAVGGIRMPDLEAPLATHRSEAEPGGGPFGLGHTTPFPAEKVRSLYPDQAAWYAKYEAAVKHLVETKAILPDDAESLLFYARAAELPG